MSKNRVMVEEKKPLDPNKPDIPDVIYNLCEFRFDQGSKKLEMTFKKSN